MAQLYWAGRQTNQAEAYAQYSLTVGQQLEAYPLCAQASFTLALAQLQDLNVRAALEHYHHAREYARWTHDIWVEGGTLQRMSTALVMVGQFDEVRAVAEEAHEMAEQTNNWWHHGLTYAAMASVAVATGAFEAAECYVRDAMKSVSRYRFSFGGALALPALAYAHALRGSQREAESALDMLVEPGYVFEQPAPIYIALTKVYRQLTQRYITGMTTPHERMETLYDISQLEDCDITSLPLLCALVELNAYKPEATLSTSIYQRLVTIADQGTFFTRGWVFLLPRIMGLVAAHNEWWDQAESHFRKGVALASDIGARPELGRTYLDYAYMLLTRNQEKDNTQISEMIQKARLIVHDLDMMPFVQQSHRLLERLETL